MDRIVKPKIVEVSAQRSFYAGIVFAIKEFFKGFFG